MRGMNKVVIIGHLGHNPELRTTPGGSVLCELRIATNRSRKSGEQWVDETDWHSVTIWDQQAELACRYLVKGSPVAIEGRLKTDSWDDKQTGQRRYRTYVVGERLHLVGGRPAEGAARAEPLPPPVAEEEIPF